LATKTAAQAVAIAKSMIGMPYWYACSGQKPTQLLLDELIHGQFGYKWTPPRIAKAWSEIGHYAHCFDCVGFIRFCAGMQKNRDALYTNANKLRTLSNPQPLSTLPELPGVLLFMKGHVGMYVGRGRVVECYGFERVANRPISAQAWTSWGKCPWIAYQQAGDRKQTAGKSLDDIAREVCRGNWGNGEERKKRLAAAGYDYAAVQKRVHEHLKKQGGST
jgi:hypothetical protein